MNRTTWKKIIIKPIINIVGNDDFLIDFSKTKCINKILSENKNVEKIELDAFSVNTDKIIEAFSDSLFSTEKLIIINNSNKLQIDQIDIIKNRLMEKYYIIFIKKPPKALNDIIVKKNLIIIDCQKIKFPSEKIDFIKNEFPRISPSAIKAIIDANFNSLEDAYALSNQISNDYKNEKFIDNNIVKIYTNDKIGTTVYKIVDAISSNKKELAIKYYNELLLSDTDKNKFINLLLNVLETKLSTIAKISVANEMNLNPIKDFGYAPWQVKQIDQILYKWNSEKLKKAISLVINTDYKIKSGKTKAPEFELQKCLLQISHIVN